MSTLDHSLQYHAAGISQLWVKADGSKMPGSKWKPYQSQPPEQSVLQRWHGNGRQRGIGLICGAVSGYLEVIDVDDGDLDSQFARSVNLLDAELLGKLSKVKTPRADGGYQYLYRCPDGVQGNQILAKSADGQTAIETRGEGGYVVAVGSPPEVHPTGNEYRHVAGPPPWSLQSITAEERETLFCVARGLSEQPIAEPDKWEGSSEELDLTKPGGHYASETSWDEILPDHGWTNAGKVGDHVYWRRPGKSHGHSATTGNGKNDLLFVHSSNAEPFESGQLYSKFAAYSILQHGGNMTKASAKLAKLGFGQPVDVTAIFEDDTEYKAFPAHLLPQPFARYVVDAAKENACDVAFVGAPILAALGAAIGNSRHVSMTGSWTVPPFLWVAIVGNSGSNKSPGLKSSTGFAGNRQAKDYAKFKEAEKATDVFDESQVVDVTKDEPPAKPPRYSIKNTTVEAMAPVMADNPRGLFMVQSELRRWFGSFDKYSKGKTDASDWICLYNAEPIEVDRKTGEERHIEARITGLSLAGAIQPKLLREVIDNEMLASGLAARFLMVNPPEKLRVRGRPTIKDRNRQAVNDVFDALYDMEMMGVDPVLVPLSDDAERLYDEFHEQNARDLYPADEDLKAALVKMEETPLRLALILELVTDQDAEVITGQSMETAIALTNWFKRESQRIYALLGSSDAAEQMKAVANWIGRQGKSVSARDVNIGMRIIESSEQAEKILKRLVDANLGEFVVTGQGKKGRPSHRFRMF